LLKGAHSVLADPWGAAVVLTGTTPRVARPGLGDVLAGFATGWGAQAVAAQPQPGLESFTAAAALHGLAAVRACPSSASAISACLQIHAAEFARLFPDCGAGDELERAMSAARCSGCCILLKGAHSVLADPSGAAVVLTGTTPRVARTGLGDVLAGFATGWGAQAVAAEQQPGLESFTAAAALHGLAAVRARSSDASAIADYLKINTAQCQKKKTTMFKEV